MEKILAVYWFLILTIVTGGIIITVNNFYSSPYDVRGVEVHLLNEKISNCISEGGFLNKALFNRTSFNLNFSKNFLSECSLNFQDIEEIGRASCRERV